MGIMEGRKGTRCGRWVHASSTNQPIMLHFLMYIVKKVKLGDSKRVL